MTEIISNEIIKEINEFIEFQIKDKCIPSISVTVIGRDDSSKSGDECHSLFKEIYHHKELKTIPNFDKSLFKVASVSKLFTYVSILQLLDVGKLSLDDKVIKYIPSFKPKNPQKYGYTFDEYEPDLYKNITIFNLIRHTSGLIREPIEGNYFNEVQSDLETLVKSMNESSLVSIPGTEYKYSNAGVAIAGYIVGVVSGMKFEDYVEKNILIPLGMKNSTFKDIKIDENNGYMWRYWDETTDDLSVYTEAPLTYFGMYPASGLVTTINDISKFLQFFLQNGKPLLKKETFIQFLTQQPLDKPVSGNVGGDYPYVYVQDKVSRSPTSISNSYGLGVEIQQIFGYEIARHGGAVNGFASDFRVLPELGIGIFTVTTLDVCNAISQQVSEFITCQLASNFVKPNHSPVVLNQNGSIEKVLELIEKRKQFLLSTISNDCVTDIPDDLYDEICGYWYEPTETEKEAFNDNYYIQILKSYNNTVYCKSSTMSKLKVLTNKESGTKSIITADRMSCNQILLTIPKDYTNDQISTLKIYGTLIHDTLDSKNNLLYCRYKPLPLKPEITIQPPFMEEFKDLIGFYTAKDHLALIFEEDGCLNFNIEWLFNYKMKFISASQHNNISIVHFLLSPSAMYNNEIISFHMIDGKPVYLSLSGIKFTFKSMSTIGIQQPGVYEPNICQQSLDKSFSVPFPFENSNIDHNLIDLAKISETFKLDIKYASTDNFTSIKLYKESRAFLNKKAAQGLLSAHNWLIENWNVGIVILDAYRPWNVTWAMAESVCPDFRGKYVADPKKGSVHNRGGAVDISLYNLSDGEIIEMVGDFDELSIRSHRSYFGGTERQRWFRKLLTIAMVNNGFSGYPMEWWHFDYCDNNLPVLNVQFEDISD